MPIFDLRDFSTHGSPTWYLAHPPYTSHAPPLVLTLLLLSLTQIILGTITIVSIQSLPTATLTFAQVIQPLVIPALSFFNTIPSLHLHVLARSNKPLMAMIFSSIMGIVYLGSVIAFLIPCTSPNPNPNTNTNGIEDSQFKKTECPTGMNRGLWGAQVALQVLSAVGYFMHVGMAYVVRRVVKRRERDEREGRVVVEVDEVGKRGREEEARRRWMEIRDL